MSLTKDEVKNIAHLARLHVTGAEMDAYVDNLSRILDFVRHLDEADTSGVEPMAHPLNMTQRLRSDEVTETDRHEEFQQNTASVEAGLYLVPKVIE